MKNNFFILCFLLVFYQLFNGTSCSKLIKKVAIIGGGPAGLGLATAFQYLHNQFPDLHLENNIQSIDIFESRNSVLQTSLGGGVQLSGGAIVLEKLGLLSKLKKTSLNLRKVLGRDVNGDILLQLNIEKGIKDLASLELCSNDSNKDPMLFAIMRDGLQKLLYDAIIESQSTTNITTTFHCEKSFVCLSEDLKKQTVDLKFSDGTTYSDYDMVFGADGIRSKLKDYVVSDYPYSLDSLLTKQGLIQNRYTGIRITFIVSPDDPKFLIRNKNDINSFHQYFSNGCYTLCGSYGGINNTIQHMLAIVYRDKNEKYGASWIEDSNSNSHIDMSSVKLYLEASGLKNIKEIDNILLSAESDRIIDLPIRDRYLPLNNWASRSRRVILLGDSAHPMAPFLGQGANQALQDAYVLATEINKYNNDINYSLNDVVVNYEEIRKIFTARISVTAGILGFIETLSGKYGIFFRDNLFRVLNTLSIALRSFIDIAKPRI